MDKNFFFSPIQGPKLLSYTHSPLGVCARAPLKCPAIKKKLKKKKLKPPWRSNPSSFPAQTVADYRYQISQHVQAGQRWKAFGTWKYRDLLWLLCVTLSSSHNGIWPTYHRANTTFLVILLLQNHVLDHLPPEGVRMVFPLLFSTDPTTGHTQQVLAGCRNEWRASGKSQRTVHRICPAALVCSSE